MFLKAKEMKDNVFMRNLFYNRNIDVLFNDRGYVFPNDDIGEKIFRKMIFDSILFFDKEAECSLAMRNPNEVLKDTLKNDYSTFIEYVDCSLADKDFNVYCGDSYDKAIECASHIYEKINGKNSSKTLSRTKGLKTVF